MHEKAIGRVEHRLDSAHSLPVNFILYSQSAYQLHSQLESPQQISASAYPREKDNVFIITLQNIQVPEELKPDLRPGLTGRAKIQLGREALAWWATKRMADWVRLKLLH